MNNKVALITDTHAGVRNDSIFFHDVAKEFYDEIFFPTLEEREIDQIIHLGDVLDRRRTMNVLTANRLQEDFFDKLAYNHINLDIIIGNHDTYFKNTNDVNGLDVITAPYADYVTVYTDPIERKWGNLDVLYLPWICDDNRSKSMKMIEKTKATVVLGHLEVTGCMMNAGRLMDERGLSQKALERFDLVCSGHFHHRATTGNINYLGNPWETTWSDYGNAKGFHILDTDTGELEFIPNPRTLFMKHAISENTTNVDDANGKYVKAYVRDHEDQKYVDRDVKRLEAAGALEVKVIDETSIFTSDTDDVDASELDDTPTLIERYVDTLDTPLKKEVKWKLTKLYSDALVVE